MAAAVLLLVAPTATKAQYTPTAENLKARQEFADSKFGIFIHWGIYSMFAQGEWYLQNYPIDKAEYAKAADAFYPHRFNAKEWVAAIKDCSPRKFCPSTYPAWSAQCSLSARPSPICWTVRSPAVTI